MFHGHHINHFSKCVAVENPLGAGPTETRTVYSKNSSKKQIFHLRQYKVQNMQKKTLGETVFLLGRLLLPFPRCGGHQNLWLAVHLELQRWEMKLEREKQA